MRLLRVVAGLVVGSWLMSCSTESNINQYFVAGKHKESMDTLMAEAQYEYDQGEYDSAIAKAEKAFAINSENEEAAVLLGYIYLSKAGIDPFQLAKSLISSSAKTEEGAKLAESSSSAAGQLSSLSSIVGVTSEELQLLAKEEETTTEPPAAFADYPVIRPALAPDARARNVPTLQFVNRAIKVICPFVSRDILISTDPRHTDTACPETTNTTYLGAKAHFLWAFSHLADALSFYSLVLYSTQADGSPNLVKRAAAVGSGVSSVSEYINLVTVLNEDISAIFQTTENNSALNAVLNGLGSASLAFGQLAGMPESLTTGISSALESIKNPDIAAPSGGNSAATADASKLKGQLTGDVAAKLSDKMEELKADPETAAEYESSKGDICTLYTSISAGEGDVPDDCK